MSNVPAVTGQRLIKALREMGFEPGWPPENPPPVVGSKSPSPPSGVQPDNSSEAELVFSGVPDRNSKSAAFAALALYGRI
jgi:hypothetical protein